MDVTTGIVTAKHTAELTAGYYQRNVTIDGCLLCTTEHLIHVVLGHTFQHNVHVTIHVSMTTGTIDLTYIQFSTAVSSCGGTFTLTLCANIRSTTNITSGITCTIYIVDITTKELGLSFTCTILL